MNPMQVAQNRTARLVQEARTPVYTSTREREEAQIIRVAQNAACTAEYCLVCKRCTDHWGEHSDEQLLTWARSPLGKVFLGD